MLCLQKFDLNITYKRGAQMYVADTLSRAFLPYSPTSTEDKEDVVHVEYIKGEAEKDTENIDMLLNLSVSQETLSLIHQTMDSDEVMQALQAVIKI